MNGEYLALGVIPARAHSSRFPFKVIAEINGKPMIQYVWEAAQSSSRLFEVVIATDDASVSAVAQGFGAKVRVTSSDLNSGTDRVAVVARDSQAHYIVNLQGDEPLLPASAIDRLVESLAEDTSVDMVTLAVERHKREELDNPNVVKVQVDAEGFALRFSRSPLTTGASGKFLKHIGIYGYRREALMRFCEMAPTLSEQTERLEQLRALENGFRIKVVLLQSDMIAVDVPEDIARVEEAIAISSGAEFRLE